MKALRTASGVKIAISTRRTYNHVVNYNWLEHLLLELAYTCFVCFVEAKNNI